MNLIKSLLLITALFNFSCSKAQQQESPISKKQEIMITNPITIGSKFKMQSKVLDQEKEIYISLPHKYNEHVQSYPVVFVLEAELLFESTKAITSFMAARSKMPQAIIIGIPNDSYEKRSEMGFKKWGGKPAIYLDFFRKELIPYIEKNYRANSHRIIIGISPTNGLLFEAFLNQPDIFKGYIALTMHWDWNPENTPVTMVDRFIETITNSSYPKATIYIGTADEDMRYSGNSYKEAIAKLNALSITNVKYKVDVLPEEEHYLMSLSGIRNGFKLMYPNKEWKFQRLSDLKNPVKNVKEYYERLSSKYEFDIYPLEDSHGHYALVGQAHNLARWKDKYTNQHLINFLKLSIQYYPNSANLHLKLAEAFKIEGNKELSIKTAQKAIKLTSMYHPEELEYYKNKFERLKK